MILSNEEKKRLVDNLTWMITDMQFKSDAEKRNFEEGSQGGYSSHLQEAMSLLEDIKKTDTIETTGCHRKAVAVNCRAFKGKNRCLSNKSGICALAAITLEISSDLIVGSLKCVQAVQFEEEEKSNGTIQKTPTE